MDGVWLCVSEDDMMNIEEAYWDVSADDYWLLPVSDTTLNDVLKWSLKGTEIGIERVEGKEERRQENRRGKTLEKKE